MRFNVFNTESSIAGGYLGAYLSVHVIYHTIIMTINDAYCPSGDPDTQLALHIPEARQSARKILQMTRTLAEQVTRERVEINIGESAKVCLDTTMPTAFVLYAISFAIGLLSAFGRMSEDRECSNLMESGLSAIEHFGTFWASAREQIPNIKAWISKFDRSRNQERERVKKGWIAMTPFRDSRYRNTDIVCSDSIRIPAAHRMRFMKLMGLEEREILFID